MRSIAPVLLLTAFLAPVAGADEWKQTYPGKPGGTVRVKTDDGSVTIRGWDRNEIEAQVHTIGYTIGPGEVRIVDQKLADGLDIEVIAPKRNWGWNTGRREIRVELKVPRKLALTLRTADGSVDASGLTGKVDIETSDGSVAGSDLTGDVRLFTKDGSIRVDGLAGTVHAETADGSVNVSGRFDRLVATTADGSIRADAQAGSKVSAPWTLRSSDGSIILAVPSDLAADVEARASDGSVASDLPLSGERKEGRSWLSGKLNGGGPRLSLQTNDGSIRLRGR